MSDHVNRCDERARIVASLVHRAQELADAGVREPRQRARLWEQRHRIELRVNALVHDEPAITPSR